MAKNMAKEKGALDGIQGKSKRQFTKNKLKQRGLSLKNLSSVPYPLLRASVSP